MEYTGQTLAFAAFSDRGHLLYATIKPTAAEAREMFERLNPEMQKGYFDILPVYIGVDKGFQYDLEDAIRKKGS